MKSNPDEKLKLDTSVQIGLLRKQLFDGGITDIAEVGRQMELAAQIKTDAGLYSFDKYTQNGSSPQAIIHDGKTSQDCVVWCINHYLGLNRNERVIRRAQGVLEKFGTGCGTSAASGGFCTLHKELEERLADYVGKERVVLFPTGFTANVGAISGLLGRDDLILSDRENHASIIDGCRSSQAQFLPFRHNDVVDLEKKLRTYGEKYNNVIVIVESAYSMSGDVAPLKEIVALKSRYGFFLYVDEAHTFGFYGNGGRGYCDELGVTDHVDFIMSTLSKSTASIGGFIAMGAHFYEMVRWSARSYIFQASMPPADVAAVLAALDEIEDHPELAVELHKKNHYFRNQLTDAGFDLGASQSPIVPIYIPDQETLQRTSAELLERGIFSIAVEYPAVKPSEGRLRFILNLGHTNENIDYTVEALIKCDEKFGITKAAI